MTVADAAFFLKRDKRRVYQLLESGDLLPGDFTGSILRASVHRYKRKIDDGTVRRGRPNGKAKRNNGRCP